MKDVDKALNELLEKFIPKFDKAISIDYGIGSAMAITNAKLDGRQTKLNPLELNKKDQEANIKIISELVKGVNNEIAKKINYLVNKNITERGSNVELAKDLKGLFEEKNPNYYNYKNRFKTIARTESTRIMNTSANNTANRLGASKKYISITNDNRTSDISKEFAKKYGSPEKAIPVDEEFQITYKGKIYKGLYPPFHVSDRDIVLYVWD